jgi:hypothetical protein
MRDAASIREILFFMGLLLISFFSAFSQERKTGKDSVYIKPTVFGEIKSTKSQTQAHPISDKSILPNKGKNKFDKLSSIDRQIYMMRADFLSLIVYSFNGKLKRYKNLKKQMEFDEKVFALKKNYYAGYFRTKYGIEENQLNSFLDYCSQDEEFKSFLRKDFDQLKLMEFFQMKSKKFLALNLSEE